MLYRPYRKSDIEGLMPRLEAHLKETSTYKDEKFDAIYTADMLYGNVNNKLFFLMLAVDEIGDKIVGAMCASVVRLDFSKHVIAKDKLIYIDKEYRGGDILVGLLERYVEWSKARGTVQTRLTNSTGMKIELFARLAEKLGFKQIGTIHSMEM